MQQWNNLLGEFAYQGHIVCMNPLQLALSGIRNNYKAYIFSLFFPSLVLFGTWQFGRFLGLEDLGELTRDPNTVLKGHVYTGMISNAGIFFWSASATICLFMAVFLYERAAYHGKTLLMLFAGLLSFVMGFDDVYQMHEKMFIDIRYIPEELFFLAYAVFMAFIVLVCFRTFMQTDFMLWFMALGLFMLSLLVDHDFIFVHKDHAFWEDSFKFAGIFTWSVYYLRTAMLFLLQEFDFSRNA